MLGVSTAAPCALLLKLVVREALAGGFLVGECDVVGGLGVAELPSLGHVAAEGGYLVFLGARFRRPRRGQQADRGGHLLDRCHEAGFGSVLAEGLSTPGQN